MSEREKEALFEGVYMTERMETSHDHIALKGKHFVEITLNKA